MNSNKEIINFWDKVLLFPIWFLSLFSLKLLFVKSWGIYFLLYHIFGYRRKVVYENLRRSFPEKNEKDIQRIARRYYLHLSDSIFEVVHMLRMNQKEVDRRYKITNPELAQELFRKDKDVIVVGGHYGNWEWASFVNHIFDYKLLGVYKPLSNRFFDRFFVYLRSRFGGYPVPMNGTLRAIMDAKRKNERIMVYLVSDQRPLWNDLKNWTTFLKQETPVITGPEKLSRRFDLATVFMETQQIKRGYYEITLHLITENSSESKEFELTKQYLGLLEKRIIEEPEFYLWSHKRWKYNKKDVIGGKKQVHE